MRNLTFKFFALIIIAALFYSCSEKVEKKTESQYADSIKAKVDSKQYDQAIIIIDEFTKEYPKSDKIAYALNQKAGIQTEKKDHLGAIKTYQELAEKFPNTKDAKQALFMVAFMYDETLKDKDNAVKAYKAFLEKYPKDTDPNDKMSESASTMLEVLQSGKSIEEIIQENINKTAGQQKTDTGKVQVKELTKENPSTQEKKPAQDDPANEKSKE